MIEDLIADYKLELQETASCCKILQKAIQSEDFTEETKIIDDTLEIIIVKLQNLIEKTEEFIENKFNQ